MAELNRVKTRLLGNYNSLLDENLADYFNNPRIRKHLLRAGLIRQNGEIVSPEDYKSRVLEEQRWLASQAFLAQAIVQRALDLEYSRRAQLQKQLEEIIRLELVERVRSAKKGPQHSIPSVMSNKEYESLDENFTLKKMPILNSSAEITKKDSANYDIDSFDSDSGSSDIKSNNSAHFALQNKTRATCSANSRLQEKAASPYSIPLMNGKYRPVSRTRSATHYMKSRPNLIRKGLLNFPSARALTPGPRNVQYSSCEVSLRFMGTRSFFSASVNGGRQDIMIKQQLAGGNPIVVFYEPLTPGSVFTFTSKRYVDFPFSVTIYVDNIIALRLSACCEYKYTVGYRLGGPQGYFTLVAVHGSRLCEKCNPRKKNKLSFLPPMRKSVSSGLEVNFKANNKSTWSKRPYSAKKVALIPPSGKANDHKLLTSRENNNSWVLNVGISPWVETNTENLKCDNKQLTVNESCNEKKENVSEDEITEEITSELQINKKEIIKDTSIVEVDEELDSESGSTTGSSSEGTYTSSSSQKTTIEGPKIKVTNADDTQTNSNSVSGTESGSESETESYSTGSYSGSTESEDNKSKFLKPEDAKLITKKRALDNKTAEPIEEQPNELKDTNNDLDENTSVPAEKRQIALQKMQAIDSSDDENPTSPIKQTVVHADVHSDPETVNKQIPKNNENGSKSHSPPHRQDSLKSEKTLERKESLTTINSKNPGPRRRSSIYQIVRNLSTASDDTENDPNDVLDSGNEIEVIGQNISEHITELCEELELRPDLITLTISKGGIDDLNIAPVIDALINSNCPLKSLNLNYNHLGPQAGQQIARLVREKPTLNNLCLRANPLHDSGLCPIVSALLANNSAFHNLQDDSLFGLYKLDVGDCNFRNEGATNLASLIEQSVYLNSLILTGNNQLNDDDWSSIFWSVGQNSHVSTLFIDHCLIGDEGVECLTKIVKYHPSLQAVDLEWNQIGDEGAKILLNWIKQNPKLTVIRLECGNNVKETIMQDINKALENNSK